MDLVVLVRDFSCALFNNKNLQRVHKLKSDCGSLCVIGVFSLLLPISSNCHVPMEHRSITASFAPPQVSRLRNAAMSASVNAAASVSCFVSTHGPL